MELLGSIVRLQVQGSSLKLGTGPARRYDPTPLRQVSRLRIGPEGVSASDDQGRVVLDVHNALHEASKNAGKNAVSVGFTAHYRQMRERFGDRLADGLAGENILVDTEGQVDLEQLESGLVVRTAGGEEVELERLVVAEPCVPFSRYALGIQDLEEKDERLTETLRFLRHGMRGFYATYQGAPLELNLGDRVFHR